MTKKKAAVADKAADEVRDPAATEPVEAVETVDIAHPPVLVTITDDGHGKIFTGEDKGEDGSPTPTHPSGASLTIPHEAAVAYRDRGLVTFED